MELQCENCGAIIPEENFSIETRIAHCANCDAVFDFTSTLITSKTVQNALAIPKSVEFNTTPTGIIIAYRWLNWRSPLFLAGGLLVSGTPLMLFNVVGGEDQTVSPLILLASLPIVLFGLWLIYYSMALFINKTKVILDHDNLRIVHTPLPLRQDMRLKLSDLDSIYKQHIQFGNQYTPSIIYNLYAKGADGTEIQLLRGLSDSQQMDFIVHQLKSYLIIQRAHAENQLTV